MLHTTQSYYTTSTRRSQEHFSSFHIVLPAHVPQTKHDKNMRRCFVEQQASKCSARRITKKAAIRLAKRGEIAKYS